MTTTIDPGLVKPAKQIFDECVIGMVLDRSGSMESCIAGTIEGFNAFIKQQQEIPGKAWFHMLQFDDRFETVYPWADLATVSPLNTDTFKPRGSTALFDAIGQTLTFLSTEVAKKCKGTHKVIVAILTDGFENASREYTKEKVFDLIHKKQDEGWEILFLAANQDAIASATSMGIATRNSSNFMASSAGTRDAYHVMSASTASYRTGEKFDMPKSATPDPDADKLVADELIDAVKRGKHKSYKTKAKKE